MEGLVVSLCRPAWESVMHYGENEYPPPIPQTEQEAPPTGRQDVSWKGLIEKSGRIKVSVCALLHLNVHCLTEHANPLQDSKHLPDFSLVSLWALFNIWTEKPRWNMRWNTEAAETFGETEVERRPQCVTDFQTTIDYWLLVIVVKSENPVFFTTTVSEL